MRSILFLVVFLLAFVAAPIQAQAVKLAITDLVGLEQLQAEFGAFVEVLEDATGFDIEFYPVTNRTAAAEALRFKRIDFVLTGPAEYVVMRKRTKAEPVVGFSRPDYFSGIIVMADSKYQTVADLKGEKIAVGSVGSTSNHLGPMQVMADLGLDARNQAEVIHTDRKIAWESLKNGDIAAIGINYGKFQSLREKEMVKQGGLPPGAFRVIGRGRDLPNDVLMVGPHVDRAVVTKLRNAFTSQSDQLIAAILKGEDNQKYRGMKFLAEIDDADYNYVRMMYKTIGYPEYADFVGD